MKFQTSVLSRSIKATILAASGLVVSQSALSAGFALNDHSATASGNALAGAAASNSDLSFSFWNPALLDNGNGLDSNGNGSRSAVYASGALILPDMDVTVNSAADPVGNPMTGEANGVVDNSFVPSLHYAYALDSDTTLGASFNVPFGLAGKYGRDWAGRYHSAETEVQVLTLALSASHKLSPELKVGGSVQVHRGYVLLASALTDFNGGNSAGGEGYGELEGDDISVGYAFGLAYEPMPGTRLGVGHRSKIDFTFEGDAKYENVPPTMAALGVDNAYVFDQIDFPSVTTLSLEHDMNEKVTLGLTAMHTGWSSMDELRIAFAAGEDKVKQPDSVLTFDFEDQWFYSVGATFQANDKLTLRTGFAKDNSPVKEEYRSARTPDGDRTWMSLGGSYQLSADSSFHLAYTYVNVDKVNLNRTGQLAEDASRGSVNADYDTEAHVFSVGFNMNF